MSAIYGWDQRVLVQEETVFGEVPDPASAQGIEVISLDMGPGQQGFTRPKKDKTNSRDMTLQYVEGRVPAMPFSLHTSVKSRASAIALPVESVLYKACGLTETVGGSSVSYAMDSFPAPVSCSILSVLGTGSGAREGEHGRGGTIRSVEWNFGDQELTAKFAGEFIGKYHLGYSSSGSLTDAADTSLTLTTPSDAYQFSLGWYQIGAEVVRVTAVDYTTGILTVERGELATTAAAHTNAAIYPHMPTLALNGTPISEVNCTITIDSLETRCTKGSIAYETGISLLPGETGSTYIRGPKVARANAVSKFEMVLDHSQVVLLGKMTQRKNLAVTVTCGSGAGNVVTFSLPFSELKPFAVPTPYNDISIISVEMRHRGNAGNDSFSFALT